MPRRKRKPNDLPPRPAARSHPVSSTTSPAKDVLPVRLPKETGDRRAALDPTGQGPVEVELPVLDNQFLSQSTQTGDLSDARVGDSVSREVAEDFEERQGLASGGAVELTKKFREHHSLSPEISAGDVDAAWDYGRASGEETFTGHAPTPDQDVVDELGLAAGLTYRDDEPLNYAKVAQRDAHRWELDPRSALEADAEMASVADVLEGDLDADPDGEDEVEGGEGAFRYMVEEFDNVEQEDTPAGSDAADD